VNTTIPRPADDGLVEGDAVRAGVGEHLHGHHVPWRWDDGTETIIHLPGKT